LISVELFDLTANEATDIVHELQRLGYQQSVDFNFAYHPGRWDEMTGEIPRRTAFTFYSDALATFFKLKYTPS
jgi:hypothetical protein